MRNELLTPMRIQTILAGKQWRIPDMLRATRCDAATVALTVVGFALMSVMLSTTLDAQSGRGSTKAPPKPAATVTKPAVSGGAWSMPDPADLVERVIRRIVTQDKPGAVPIGEFKQRAFGRAATLAAVRSYLGHDVELPSSVYASVATWTDAGDKLPVPDCPAADSTCAAPSTVWLAVTKFEKGDLPRELNVWYTTSFIAKPHDQLIISRYAFCERWLRVDGTWRYDGFIRVLSGQG